MHIEQKIFLDVRDKDILKDTFNMPLRHCSDIIGTETFGKCGNDLYLFKGKEITSDEYSSHRTKIERLRRDKGEENSYWMSTPDYLDYGLGSKREHLTTRPYYIRKDSYISGTQTLAFLQDIKKQYDITLKDLKTSTITRK